MSNYIGVYEYPSLALSRNTTAPSDNILDVNVLRYNFLFSPCSGPDQSIDHSDSFDLLIVSCNGQYNVFQATTLKFMNSVRQMYNISSSYFSIYQRKRSSTLQFLTADYFLDSFYRVMFIFSIQTSATAASGKEALLVGTYASSQSVNHVSSLKMVYITGETAIYGFEMLCYSDMILSKISIPLRATTSLCKLETSATLFLTSLGSLE